MGRGLCPVILSTRHFSLFESHVVFFAHTKAWYDQMVDDNMRVAIARFTDYEKESTEALLQLRGHYQFKHRFTDTYRGDEKGHFERSLEYVRRKAWSEIQVGIYRRGPRITAAEAGLDQPDAPAVNLENGPRDL